jgi:capsular exopolysaccharide synthesis family protein
METEFPPVEQTEEGLDLREYFSLFLHWSWLILLAAVVAGTVAYFLSVRMTPYYQSTTTTLVNEAPATKTTDYSSVMMSEQLATTYSKMMTNDPVLIQVAYQTGLNVSLADLKKWITVTPIQNTQLIQVSVETTDPNLSAKIANAIATVFAAQIQDIQSQRFSQSKATLETQLAEIQSQITADTLQANSATTPEDKARLDSKLTQDRAIYNNLLLSYEQVQLSEAQSVSSVVQVEPAIPEIVPVRPKVMQNTLLAAVLGFLLSAGVIVAREALDDTVKTPDGVSRTFKLPILGVINHHSPEQNSPITITAPRSPTAEAYRTLRTNVNFASVDRPLRTLMVTSPEPGEGKTTTISNLGVVMAQNGKTVIVADCDLRHPRVHTYFGLSNRMGISTLFSSNLQTTTGTRQPTKVEHLTVVATGALPPNPSELLGSQRMQAILNAMRQTSDVILIDTPPALAVTDAAALAPSLDGVLVVVRPGKTRMSALKQTLEQLKQVNARVLGVVLNDVVTRGKAYGYHYQYYRNYAAYQDYYGSKGKGKKGIIKGKPQAQ